jgi:hypothetical protein
MGRFRAWRRRAGLGFAGMLTVAALAVASSALARQREAGTATPATDRVRIGTYDSRAVAIAYGRSKAFLTRVNELREQHKRATGAGDQKAADRLAQEAQALQLRIHLQGFSNAPVDDILAKVSDRLPQLAQRRGVAAVVSSADYRDDARVEVVDVTDDLTALFEPDEQTQKVIADLKRQAPLPIEQVARMDHAKH